MGEVVPGSYLADPTSPIPSHCASVVVTSTLRVNIVYCYRQEMVSLLAMSDRTHSQLMDTMPEKCGLTGQAKDFEPTLKEVGVWTYINS